MKLDGALCYEKSVYVSAQDLQLDYRMLSLQQDGREIYCLSIVLIEGEERESCLLWDVATCHSMAKRIWQLFTEGLVTPVTAQDIMEQLLSDRDFLYAD